MTKTLFDAVDGTTSDFFIMENINININITIIIYYKIKMFVNLFA